MTDPVILLGTQSNGETLPVQVDGFGRLVAEGLQGPEGPAGENGQNGQNGEPGPPGGDFPLPPDPYEGALLGWLNGELSWIGSPPVPIPPGVFGPITEWDAQNGLLTVEGEIPAGSVGSGVFVWQCNPDGTYFTEGWNVSQVWSANTTGTWDSTYGVIEMFDADDNTFAYSNGSPASVNFTNLKANSSIRIYGGNDNTREWTITIDGVESNIKWNTSVTNAWVEITGLSFPVNLEKITNTNGRGRVGSIEIDGEVLVDKDLSLNLRVNQVLGQSLLGIPSSNVDFTIGKYLNVPEQRVAPWVLYGNDPTSLIDHLRSS